MLDLDDTIVAVATPPGAAIRAVLRLSGRDAWPIVQQALRATLPARDGPARAVGQRHAIYLPGLAAPVPATLYLWRAPRSFTGQDLIEVHSIGSPPIVQLVLETLVAAGARHAMPGEFTMRAFLHGKLDLTVAEAIAGLVDAATAAQADTALRQLAGGIAQPIGRLRDALLDLLAELEAGLDFADEDLEFIDRRAVRDRLQSAALELAELGRQMSGRTTASDRRRVVLAGPPNAGKSTLFNALLGRDAALVGRTPGTTRDYLEAVLRLPGGRIELIDTAGVESVDDPVRRSAQDQRLRAVESADLILWCCDASVQSDPPAELLRRPQDTVVVVHTKSDLAAEPTPDSPSARAGGDHSESSPVSDSDRSVAIRISAVTGAGLDALRVVLDEWTRGARGSSGVVARTAVRCARSIAAAQEFVERARETLDAAAGDDLIAMELRAALEELGHVVGAVFSDDILDRVFSRFCIGK